MTDLLPRRERNRVQTWQAIHSTAATLVLQRGLATATVDDIANEANVSRRTFFNYFASKEDAVLGTAPAELSDDDIRAFTNSTDDLFGRVVRLMTAAVRSVFHDLPSFSIQRELLKKHPELRNRLDQHVREAESLVHDQLGGTGDDEDTRALLLLAGTVMRFAFTPRPDGSIDATSETIDAAIARFRHVMKEAL